jgi:RNA polymerase sigma-70 factor, ECF subfamily
MNFTEWTSPFFPAFFASGFIRDDVMDCESESPAALPLVSAGNLIESSAFILPEDSEKLGRLLEEFRPYLLAIANAELPQALAAKLGPSDVVQITLAKGQFQSDCFRGKSREELARWLRRILRNHLLNVTRAYTQEKRDVRREQWTNSQIVHPRQLSPSDEVMAQENRALLIRALDRLPEAYRRVIELRHHKNLSFAELGGRLNRSEEAARKLWTRAVRKLQQELGTDGSR